MLGMEENGVDTAGEIALESCKKDTIVLIICTPGVFIRARCQQRYIWEGGHNARG